MYLREAPQNCYDIVSKVVYEPLRVFGGIFRGFEEL